MTFWVTTMWISIVVMLTLMANIHYIGSEAKVSAYHAGCAYRNLTQYRSSSIFISSFDSYLTHLWSASVHVSLPCQIIIISWNLIYPSHTAPVISEDRYMYICYCFLEWSLSLRDAYKFRFNNFVFSDYSFLCYYWQLDNLKHPFPFSPVTIPDHSLIRPYVN